MHSDQIRLGDLVSIKHGWPFKSGLFSEKLTGKPIVVNIGNFNYGGGFRFNSTTLKEYRGDYPKEYDLAAGDVLLVMTCQTAGGEILGIPGRIPNDGRVYLHNQRLGKLVVNRSDLIEREYLYYLFLSPGFNRHLFDTASGTKILHTSPGRIEEFQFSLCPLSQQREAASLLRALDDKIELNQRMNETLDAVARTIFKSWFLDFDQIHGKPQKFLLQLSSQSLFPSGFEKSQLGPIPRGWILSILGDHVEVTRGLSYKGNGLSSEGLPMHNLNSVYEGGGYKYEGIKHYVGEYKPRHLIKSGEIIVANTEQGFDYLLIGYPAIVPRCFGGHCLFSHHLFKVVPRADSPLARSFLYYLLMTPTVRDQVVGCTNGTTVNMLSADGLTGAKFLLPPQALISAFEDFANPCRAKIEENVQCNETLTTLRDYLLPKLISGKIRIGQAEKIVEAHA